MYLKQFIPDRVKVFFDGVAAESNPSNTDLHVGVALPFHHAPHEVVFGDQVLGLHQVDP